MTPLKANLKHLYQCLAMWLLYAVLPFVGVLFVAALEIGVGRGPEGAVLFLTMVAAFALGLLMATVQRDVLSKPFVFVLPGHEPVMKRMVGVVGKWVALVVALALLYAARGPVLVGAGVFLASLAWTMAAYLAGVAVVFARGWVRQTVWAVFPAGFFLFVFSGLIFRPLFGGITESLRQHCVVWLLAGVGASAVALPWWRAGRLGRGVCGGPGVWWIGSFGAWRGEKAKRMLRERLDRIGGTPIATPTWRDRVLLPLLARSGRWGVVRDIWGEAYGQLSRWQAARVLRGLSWWAPVLVFWCLVSGSFETAAPPGPLEPMKLSNMLGASGDFPILYLPMLLQLWPSPFVPTLLLASGRRERFRREMVSGGLCFAGLYVGAVLVVLLCRWVFAAAPAVTVGGHAFAMRAPDLWAVGSLLWTAPVALMVRLAGKRSLWHGALPGLLFPWGFLWLPYLRVLPVVVVVAIGAIIWGGYGVFVWRRAMRSDWVG